MPWGWKPLLIDVHDTVVFVEENRDAVSDPNVM
jgi:hypothetical protein